MKLGQTTAKKRKKGTTGGGQQVISLHKEKMLEVLRQFRVVLRSIKRHYQWVERTSGVSGAQLWAMAEIVNSPGVKVGDLARQLAIHQSTASNLIGRLVELELIERSRSDTDLRIVQLRLTEKGRAVLAAAPQPYVGVLQQALMELPDKDLHALREQLRRIIQLMKIKDMGGSAIPLSDI